MESIPLSVAGVNLNSLQDVLKRESEFGGFELEAFEPLLGRVIGVNGRTLRGGRGRCCAVGSIV